MPRDPLPPPMGPPLGRRRPPEGEQKSARKQRPRRCAAVLYDILRRRGWGGGWQIKMDARAPPGPQRASPTAPRGAEVDSSPGMAPPRQSPPLPRILPTHPPPPPMPNPPPSPPVPGNNASSAASSPPNVIGVPPPWMMSVVVVVVFHPNGHQ